MSRKELSRAPEWELVNDSQDVRGWPVIDHRGGTVGTVTDFVIDTDQERVTALVLNTGTQVPARELELGDRVLSLQRTGAGTTRSGGQAVADRDGAVRIPIIEEVLRVGKRAVDRGGIRVETRVEEKPVEEQVKLREEHVRVERRPADRPATANDLARSAEGTINVRERNEEVVVDKQARVVGEVIITKDVDERVETVKDTVHRTDANVRQMPGSDGNKTGTNRK